MYTRKTLWRSTILAAGLLISLSSTGQVIETFSEKAGEEKIGYIQGENFGPTEIHYTDIGGMAIFEGDIVLGTTKQIEALNSGETPESVIITGGQYRWPNNVIPYQFNTAVPQSTRNRFAAAVAHWEANTAINLVLRTASNASTFPDYVEVLTHSGCASNVGRIGGRQNIWLATACSTGNIIHEIGHTVGMWHEQSREDRNGFVSIQWNNILPDYESNFNQHISDGDDVGTYDYGSIMHYPSTAFSSNGLPTIVPLQAGVTIGQRTALSTGDVGSANLITRVNTSLDTGTAQGEQNSPDDFLSVIFGKRLSNPIVIMGPPSYKGSNPTAVRVRNVSTSGFQYQIEEWDYLDGTHLSENIGYLAFEAGRSQLGDLTIEAGAVNMDHNWKTVTFSSSISPTPVVVAQVVTRNGSQAVTTRINNVTANGFQIRLQEEEANDNTHVVETVHWVALETGRSTAGNVSVAVGRTGNSITHDFATISFGTSIPNPVFLANMQTTDGGDTATLRHSTLTSSSVQVKVEEEESADSETDHTTEVVGWIAIEND